MVGYIIQVRDWNTLDRRFSSVQNDAVTLFQCFLIISHNQLEHMKTV